MSILKVIDVSQLIGSIFDRIDALIVGLIGFALIFFAIYVKIKDIKLQKNGVPVNLTVKRVDEISESNEDNGKIVSGYKTTFEFKHNGTIKEETINTTKKFKVGSMKKGIYLEDNKKNVLSVAGEGFYLAKGGEIFMISFGLLMLFLAAFLIFGFDAKIVLYAVIIYFALLFGILYIFPLFASNSKKRNNVVKEIYYDNNEDEHSTVDGSLVRYIPKVNKIEKSKIPFGLVFAVVLLLSLGGYFLAIGIKDSYKVVNIKMTYASTTGEVRDVYKYYAKDGEKTLTFIGVIYNYEVNGLTYVFDYKAGEENQFFTHKIGDKTKLYYEKSNPANAILKEELSTGVLPLVVGIIAIYVGVYFIIENRNKTKIYNAYVVMEDIKK